MTDRPPAVPDGPDLLISGVLDEARRRRQTRSVPATAVDLVLDPLADLDIESALVVDERPGWRVSVQLGSGDDRREAARRLGLDGLPDLYGDLRRPLAEQTGTYADLEVKVYSRADGADMAPQA